MFEGIFGNTLDSLKQRVQAKKQKADVGSLNWLPLQKEDNGTFTVKSKLDTSGSLMYLDPEDPVVQAKLKEAGFKI
jgi:hypothetical protein